MDCGLTRRPPGSSASLRGVDRSKAPFFDYGNRFDLRPCQHHRNRHRDNDSTPSGRRRGRIGIAVRRSRSACPAPSRTVVRTRVVVGRRWRLALKPGNSVAGIVQGPWAGRGPSRGHELRAAISTALTVVHPYECQLTGGWTRPFGCHECSSWEGVFDLHGFCAPWTPRATLAGPPRAGRRPDQRLVGEVLLTGLRQPETRDEANCVHRRSYSPRRERELYERAFAWRVAR